MQLPPALVQPLSICVPAGFDASIEPVISFAPAASPAITIFTLVTAERAASASPES